MMADDDGGGGVCDPRCDSRIPLEGILKLLSGFVGWISKFP